MSQNETSGTVAVDNQKIKTKQRLHLPQGNFMVIGKHQRFPPFFMKMDCRFSQGKGKRNKLSSRSR